MWFDTAFGLLSVKAPKANVVGRNAGNVDDMSDFSSDEWEIIGNVHDKGAVGRGRRSYPS